MQKYKVVDKGLDNAILFFAETLEEADKFIENCGGKYSYRYKVEITDAYKAELKEQGVKI